MTMMILKKLDEGWALLKVLMISLTNIWKDKGMSVTAKKRLLNSLVFSLASHDSECWFPTEIDERRIVSFELWCYRRLLRISWTNKLTKECI